MKLCQELPEAESQLQFFWKKTSGNREFIQHKNQLLLQMNLSLSRRSQDK